MFEFESESNQTAPPRTVPHGPTGQQLPANLFRLAAHTQPMPPTPSALGLLATAYRCGDRPSPSLVPPHGAPHHWNPSGFSLTSPALKGHHAPLLQVSHPAPPFSAQEARATLPLTALPPVHPARCCRSTGKKSKPLLPLQPPHGEIKPSAIVVLRYRPLLTPRPTPPPLVLLDPPKLIADHRSPPAAVNCRCIDRTPPSLSTHQYDELSASSPCPVPPHYTLKL
jgi:hypothetical protein